MISVGGLQTWFINRRTGRAIRLVLERSRITTLTVELLGNCVRCATESKAEALKRYVDLVEEKEREAEGLQRQLMEELARGVMPVNERGELMYLGREIDWVAHRAHEAGNILTLFELSQMPKEIQDVAIEMCSTVIQCTVKLADAVQKLGDSAPDESLKAADDVERTEEKAEKLHQEARGKLNDIETDVIRTGSILLLSEFLKSVENSAERCVDACDHVRIMTIALSKRRG